MYFLCYIVTCCIITIYKIEQYHCLLRAKYSVIIFVRGFLTAVSAASFALEGDQAVVLVEVVLAV